MERKRRSFRSAALSFTMPRLEKTRITVQKTNLSPRARSFRRRNRSSYGSRIPHYPRPSKPIRSHPLFHRLDIPKKSNVDILSFSASRRQAVTLSAWLRSQLAVSRLELFVASIWASSPSTPRNLCSRKEVLEGSLSSLFFLKPFFEPKNSDPLWLTPSIRFHC